MIDIKDFFLNTPMKRPKYMQLKTSEIPKEIIEQYNLHELAEDNRYAYCKITKGMYGLPLIK